MEKSNSITFQFISEPTEVNFGGKVHGGAVMKWIDQTAFACARNWAESYCVTVYVGGIQFYKPINIGEVIKIDATVIYTGNSSIHIAAEVYSRKISSSEFEKKTHCIIVFVSVNDEGRPQAVRKWVPKTEKEIGLEKYAVRLNNMRSSINKEMEKFASM